ncbi:hypothetical protein HanXRQr2_Chr17g0826971 [Helianthus annuus]|uniref:Uncharacterized protein n=1 Tax=Helianthus annuus TaxID=4232 RepID=A0A9K3DNV6_HELAN|nr:hypothetical protein HanXRQr2_Chr17g0826971 [Helianthus annuus]
MAATERKEYQSESSGKKPPYSPTCRNEGSLFEENDRIPQCD